jgi:hypothetical protein
MKEIYIKTSCDLKRSSVQETLCAPTKPGRQGKVDITRVYNIPDNISAGQALQAFSQTMIWPSFARHEFDYAELGAGKLIKVCKKAETVSQ